MLTYSDPIKLFFRQMLKQFDERLWNNQQTDAKYKKLLAIWPDVKGDESLK